MTTRADRNMTVPPGSRRTSDAYFDAKERVQEATKETPVQPKEETHFEIVEPVAAAPARTFEDSEREYRELMTDPARVPEWAKPVNNSAAQGVLLDHDVTDVEPALIETPEAYAANVKALNDAHTKAVEELGEAHRRRLSQLLTARRNVELEEAKSNEKGLAGNLKAVLKDMAQIDAARGTPAAEAAAMADAQSEEAIEAALRARVAPKLEAAAAVDAQLHLWASQFKSDFEKLKEIDRSEWLRAMPSSTSQEIESSAAMGYQVNKLLNDVLSLYEGALVTQRDKKREIETLIKTGRFRLDRYELERALNQAMYHLTQQGEITDTLNNLSRGIVDLVGRINAKKHSTLGTSPKSIEFENKEEMLAQNTEAAWRTVQGNASGRPSVAVTDTGADILGGPRRAPQLVITESGYKLDDGRR